MPKVAFEFYHRLFSEFEIFDHLSLGKSLKSTHCDCIFCNHLHKSQCKAAFILKFAVHVKTQTNFHSVTLQSITETECFRRFPKLYDCKGKMISC